MERILLSRLHNKLLVFYQVSELDLNMEPKIVLIEESKKTDIEADLIEDNKVKNETVTT